MHRTIIDNIDVNYSINKVKGKGKKIDDKFMDFNGSKFDSFDHSYVNSRLIIEIVILCILVFVPYVSGLYLATKEMCLLVHHHLKNILI